MEATKSCRPCPFCNGEAWTFPSNYQDVTLWNCRCRTCYAAFDGFKNEAEAIAAWNRRDEIKPIMAALTMAIAALTANRESLVKIGARIWPAYDEIIDNAHEILNLLHECDKRGAA